MEQSNLQSAISIGTDLVHMPRFKKFVDNDDFIKKILTHAERIIYASLKHDKRKLEFLCGRYAVKEAYAKAKGTGIGETSFHDIEVIADEKGCPRSKKAQISISHDGDYTIAMVLIYA